MRQLDVQQIFNREIAVPSINNFDELRNILLEINAFESEGEVNESLNELRQTTRGNEVGVGIKKVLLAVEEAKQEGGNVATRFADVMSQRIAAESN